MKAVIMVNVFVVTMLFALGNSALLYESVPFGLMGERMKKDLKGIENQKYFQTMSIADFQYTKEDSTVYTLKSFTPVYNILNVDMFEFTTSNNEMVLSYAHNEQSTVSAYMMKYTAVISSASSECEVEFVLFANKYVYTKTFVQENDSTFYHPFANVDLSLALSSVELKEGNTCGIAIEDVGAAVSAFCDGNVATFASDFNTKSANVYFKNEATTQTLYTNTASDVSITHIVDVSLQSVPEVKADSILFAYKGDVDSLNTETPSPLPSSADYSSYHVYVDRLFLNTLITNSVFGFKVEESTRPVDNYKLTIEYMTQVCSELSSFDAAEQVSIVSEIESVDTFEADISGGIIATAHVVSNVTLDSTKEMILSFKWDATVKLDITLFQHGVNFVMLGKNVDVKEVKENETPKRTITNADLLKQWIKASYEIALAKKEYDLFYLAVDFGKYFNRYSDIDINVQGDFYVFSGKPQI